jgi:hypothetical protein
MQTTDSNQDMYSVSTGLNPGTADTKQECQLLECDVKFISEIICRSLKRPSGHVITFFVQNCSCIRYLYGQF